MIKYRFINEVKDYKSKKSKNIYFKENKITIFIFSVFIFINWILCDLEGHREKQIATHHAKHKTTVKKTKKAMPTKEKNNKGQKP